MAGSRALGLDPDQSRDLLADLADPRELALPLAASPWWGERTGGGRDPRWPLRPGDRLYLYPLPRL